MERAPGAGIGALSDPPGCGKWAGHHYNVPTAREIPGQKVKKEARPVIAPPPAHAAAHFAADAMRDSRRTDLFPQIAPGDCHGSSLRFVILGCASLKPSLMAPRSSRPRIAWASRELFRRRRVCRTDPDRNATG